MKKKINVVLFILVAGLWSIVLYKLAGGLFHEDLQNAENKKVYRTVAMKEKDTFRMETLARDPFLGKLTQYPKKIFPSVAHVAVKKSVTVKPVKEPIVFPELHYYGYIKGSDKKAELILMNINGETIRLQADQSYKGVRVAKIMKDSIVVVFKGQRKSVGRG